MALFDQALTLKKNISTAKLFRECPNKGSNNGGWDCQRIYIKFILYPIKKVILLY